MHSFKNSKDIERKDEELSYYYFEKNNFEHPKKQQKQRILTFNEL